MASSENSQGYVPKFSSFRPRAPVEGEATAGDRPTPREDTSREERHGSRHHHRHRSGDRAGQRHRERGGDRRKVDWHTDSRRTRTISPIADQLPPDDNLQSLFVIDKKGDNQNVVFGGLHRYSVPHFHRFGAGSVLGALRLLKIDRNNTDDTTLVLTDRREGIGSKREKYAFARNEKKGERLLRILPDTEIQDGTDISLDFVPLWSTRPKKRKRSASSSSASSDEDIEHYRSIEGKAKARTKPKDESMEYVTDSDSSNPDSGRSIRYDAAVRQKSIELSRRVDSYPQDISAWLELIAHQDALLGLSDEGHRKITSAERRSTADIKLHLYEKALEKAGTTIERRERLLIGLMTEGSKIWDFKTQSEKWERVSQENLQSLVLWKRYLDFRQSMFANFQFEEVRDIFLKRIGLLQKTISQEKSSITNASVLYEHLIYTVLRATLFMREAGYAEIAVGIWQGLLELNFHPIPFIPSSGKDSISIMEEFWDAEVPRVGEEGALGIISFSKSSDSEPPYPLVDEEMSMSSIGQEDIFRNWTTAEAFRAQSSRLPARTMDEVTEDDPYRVILWSDIKEFMIDLAPSPARTHLRYVLLNAHLLFCGLPPITDLGGILPRNWWNDSFVRNEILQGEYHWLNQGYISRKDDDSQLLLEGIQREDSLAIQPGINYFAASIDGFFPVNKAPCYFVPWRTLHGDSKTSGSISYDFMRNTLRSLATTDDNPDLAEYYLGFELCNEAKDIRKTARGLLKMHPDSHRLYNAFAMIEWSRGNKEAAINVIKAALNMPSSKDSRGCTLLWRTWAWILLDSGDRRGCLRCLFCMADETPNSYDSVDISSPTSLIKARQYLSSKRDFGSYTDSSTVTFVELLALLQYLSSTSGPEISGQGLIDAALAVFEIYSATLEAQGQNGTIVQELLLQSAAKLLSHHIRSSPFRPALVRNHLARSLNLFPQNTIFLSLYADNELRLRIDDRVRILLRDIVLTEKLDTLTSRLFAIRYEMRSGNVHSINAAFENAVSSSSCYSSAGLWRFYMLWLSSIEVTEKTFQGKTKDVFFRGIRACPWAKDLYMVAFKNLRDFMTFDELRGIYRVLGEKELRVHVDLEERFEELDELRKSRGRQLQLRAGDKKR